MSIRNKEVYKSFFQKNDLVICGNNILDWSYSQLESNNDIMIRQKVGINTYIGMNILKNTDTIEIKNVFNYDCKSNNFSDVDYLKINTKKDKILDYVKNFLLKNNFTSGLEINFLSEISTGHGFGQLGVSLSLLSLGVYVLLGKIGVDELETLEKNQYFDEIYDFSTKLISLSTDGFTLGANNYTFLTNYTTPILFERKNDSINRETILKEESLDFGVLYFGLDENFDELRKKIDYNKKYLDEEYLSHINLLGEKIKKELFLNFKNFYNDGFNQSFQNDLINTINKNLSLNNLVEKENKVIEYFKYLFENNKKLLNEEIGILPLNSSNNGGSFIFVIKDKISRYTIEKSIQDLCKKYYVFTDYMSRENIENIGAPKIKQYVSAGIISDYIDRSMVFYFDNLGNKKIGKIDEIISTEKDSIILDSINKKILINGEKIDSKTIKSQNFTIDIIQLLLENIGRDISNSILPFSSYKTDRNQIQGKIIIPFLKLIKEVYGVNLKITCTGNYDDFVLNMDKTHLKIGFIKNIN